jgi:hypothetical protein
MLKVSIHESLEPADLATLWSLVVVTQAGLLDGKEPTPANFRVAADWKLPRPLELTIGGEFTFAVETTDEVSVGLEATFGGGGRLHFFWRNQPEHKGTSFAVYDYPVRRDAMVDALAVALERGTEPHGPWYRRSVRGQGETRRPEFLKP